MNSATLSFDKQPGDECIFSQHQRNMVRHFANTWPSSFPHHQQLGQGSYLLIHASGRIRRCAAHPDFVQFVSAGGMSDLPECILHVAGPQVHNFLCQTYLYNLAPPLCDHLGQQRVKPVVNLHIELEIARNEEAQARFRYTASDDYVDRVMLVGPENYNAHDAGLLALGSISFSGTKAKRPCHNTSFA